MKLAARQLLTIDRLFYPLNWLVRGRSLALGKKELTGHVAVIKLMGLGSIIRFLSLCRAQHVDFSRVVLITFASHREACQLLGADRCLFIRTDSISRFVRDCFVIVREIIRIKPSWIIDFERCSNAVSLFRAVLSWAGGSSSLGFDDRSPIQTGRQIVLGIDGYSFHEMLMEGIKKMPVQNKSFQEPTARSESSKVIVNINCSDYLLARRYPRERFGEVIEGLNLRMNQPTFYLTGAGSERDYVEGLRSALRQSGIQVHNVAGEWTLTQLQQNLLDSTLFISGDSGPLHLAIHLRVPTLAIWGPTQSLHFGYSDREFLVNVSEELSCAPCFTHPRSTPAVACQGQITCLAKLQANTILQSAQKLLKLAAETNILSAASW